MCVLRTQDLGSSGVAILQSSSSTVNVEMDVNAGSKESDIAEKLLLVLDDKELVTWHRRATMASNADHLKQPHSYL